MALAELPSMQALLKKTQLRWAGHVARMKDDRLPKRLFFGELAKGKRNHGVQKKRYKDTLKASLKQLHLNPATWETEAQQRSAWRCTIHNATKVFEGERVQKATDKRLIRKQRLANPPPATNQASHLCPVCRRAFQAKIGLISHSRTHKPLPTA